MLLNTEVTGSEGYLRHRRRSIRVIPSSIRPCALKMMSHFILTRETCRPILRSVGRGAIAQLILVVPLALMAPAITHQAGSYGRSESGTSGWSNFRAIDLSGRDIAVSPSQEARCLLLFFCPCQNCRAL